MGDMTQQADPDDLDWEPDRDGHMADYATDDDTVDTHTYVPGQNPEEP